MSEQEAVSEVNFRRGYYCAVAILCKDHGEGTLAEYILKSYGEFNPQGIDHHDLKILRPLAKEIKRKLPKEAK